MGARALLALLLLPPAIVHAQPKTFTAPFHSVNGLILLDAKVNGNAAVMLLDTGAQFTLVTLKAANLVVNLHSFEMSAHGARGELRQTSGHARCGRDALGTHVLVADLAAMSKQIGTRIDGFVGEDVLHEFSAVRIDFKNRVVEMEE